MAGDMDDLKFPPAEIDHISVIYREKAPRPFMELIVDRRF